MSRRKESCNTCRFADVSADNQARCRFNPPTAQTLLVPTSAGELGIKQVSVLPRIQPDDWCGRWEEESRIQLM